MNEGWYFEGPDPSVGIFGELVIHECGTEDEAEEQDSNSVDGQWVVITRTWKCPGCGAETSVTESEPREWFEEPREGR